MVGRGAKIGRFTFRMLVFTLLLAILFTMSACGNRTSESESVPEQGNEENLFTHPTSSTTISAPINEDPFADITDPALVVRGVKAHPGDKNIEVLVEVKNNPGILGIDFDVYYDSSAMTLMNSESGLDLASCYYTPPSYYRNPTSFLWDFENANWVEDGTILKLYFDISETAALGEHEIKIMYSYGNIFDVDYNPIDVKVKNAHILIEE